MITIKKLLKNPSIIIRGLNKLGLLRWISDERYIKWRYYIQHNEKLNLVQPKTYNEKLQWLKLNYHNADYVKLVDKSQVREYVANKIGKEYLIPIVGEWNNGNDIKWESLPDKFVLKCTHDSGSLVISTDKSKLNKEKAINKLNKALSYNYYYSGREWPYKYVEPKIIGEEFLEVQEGKELQDYRFFCFEGDPKFITVDTNINDKEKTRRNLYDLDWNLLDAEITYPRDVNSNIVKPDNLEEMIKISRKLSKGIPHVRIDLYNLEGKVYFGEITFYHQSGLGIIRPKSFENKMGDWINISKY